MLLRGLSGSGVLVVLAGCGPRPGPHPPDPAPSLGVIEQKICTDDKTGCNDPNGTGVYMAEGGSASIGDLNLIITHFRNSSEAVLFEGRYRDVKEGWLQLPLPGSIPVAEFQGKRVDVIAINETSTALQWRLHDPVADTVFTVPAPDKSLTDLTVYIGFVVRNLANGGFDRREYVLGFQARPAVSTRSHQSLTTYDVTWRDALSAGSPPAPYCKDASGGADSVVFQQGIDVDPITGRVQAATAADLVTMSCSLGAPATVYSWGYDYHPPLGPVTAAPFHFAAAIQMKRASYCGNANPYTIAGTRIYIVDNKHIQPEIERPDKVRDLEAWWADDGAKCVNMANLRHASMGFKGRCPNKPLLPCPPSLPSDSSAYLADAPELPGAP